MKPKQIFIASDHAGFELKEKLIPFLEELNCSVRDLGPKSDKRVDYPDFADRLCLELSSSPKAIGFLVCGSGQGMAMRANKYPHIRAALCWNEESAQLSRQHNDANVLCLGGRLMETELCFEISRTFLEERFEGGRHQGRVEKISTDLT